MAISEAQKGLGFVSPNPPVGAIILDADGFLISSGYHKKFGGDHAEIEALKGLSDDVLEGAQLYVTLEPCSHQGKTPPCAPRLAQKPFQKIVYGLQDPNPLVNGKGVQILKEAGKTVEQLSEVQDDLQDLAEIFLKNIQFKKPFVALKVATSLDGQMGLKTGESQWITNEKSREYAHYLRGVYDAVVIGRRTFLIDDPSLNVRHPQFTKKPNKVVVIDPDGGLAERLPQSKLFKTHDPKDIFHVVKKGVVQKSAVTLVETTYTDPSGFDLDQLLGQLFAMGISSLLLEGGSFVYQSFLTQNKVDRIYQFQAPIILGSQTGLSWTQGFGVKTMAEKMKIARVKTQFFGTDILITGTF